MKLGVVGSINIDMMFFLQQNLKRGETVFGDNFCILMGGKGANQAIMMRALTDQIVFCGAVGNDVYAEKALSHLKMMGLDTQCVYQKETNTGLALIQVVDGDNSIAVIQGANNQITKYDVDNFLALNSDLELIVTQLEINYDAIEYLLEQCHHKGIETILNPAPARELEDKLIDKVTYLIPNETEAEIIFRNKDFEAVVNQYQGKVLVTLGSKGVLFFDSNENIPKIEPAQKINVVDSTGAGDSFIAGFAVGMQKFRSVRESVRLGIRVASLTCQTMGAQGAYNQVRQMRSQYY